MTVDRTHSQPLKSTTQWMLKLSAMCIVHIIYSEEGQISVGQKVREASKKKKPLRGRPENR